MKKTWLISGLGLLLLGVGLFVAASLNFSAGMDAADAGQGGGNIFQWNILPLGVAGLVLLTGGIAVLMIGEARRGSRSSASHQGSD